MGLTEPQRHQVDVADLWTMAVRAARAEPGRVVLPALVVFTLSAAGETVLVDVAQNEPFWPVGLLVSFAQGLGYLGLIFYSGLLDRLVGSVERGYPAPPIGEVLRTLPYLKLVVADLIVVGLVTTSSVVLLAPGIAVFTLLIIAGPIINMHGVGIASAFRLSVRSIRPHFWLVLVTLTAPLLVERELLDLVELAVGHEKIWTLFATHELLSVGFGVIVGLLVVALAECLAGAPTFVSDTPSQRSSTGDGRSTSPRACGGRTSP